MDVGEYQHIASWNKLNQEERIPILKSAIEILILKNTIITMKKIATVKNSNRSKKSMKSMNHMKFPDIAKF